MFTLKREDQIEMLSYVAYSNLSITESACAWVQNHADTWRLWVIDRTDGHGPRLQVVLPVSLVALFLALLVAVILLAIVAHQIRQRRRMRKINIELETQNKQLLTALMGTETVEGELLDTPVESVIGILKTFLQGKVWTEQEKLQLEFVIGMIASRKLFRFDDNPEVSESLEKDVKEYLYDQILQKTYSVHTIPTDNVDVIEWDELQQTDLALLSMTGAWSFSGVDFVTQCEEAGKNPFELLLMHFLREHSVLDTLTTINVPKLQQYMVATYMMYKDNPYHNTRHVCDVAQAVHWMILACDNVMQLQPLERFALLFASFIHDMSHPGVNNNFLIATRDDLAQTYNDISVLESMHVSSAFKLMAQPALNFIADFSPHKYKEFRSLVVTAILATDMAK
eukprot:TRINITY_DN5146_c0_g1_i10.p1 TRINITY_DN5146_c0_g1~~TRINITY_DN5146_c0_g1_i10.p1  ORF type:complete len:396 (+),score=74.82 TRINITY_DN5146_c0_g1_i10:846-2033(+)